jgi:hypothetical protein
MAFFQRENDKEIEIASILTFIDVFDRIRRIVSRKVLRDNSSF